MDLEKVSKQGRDESMQEDYPTMEQWWKENKKTARPTPAVWAGDVGQCSCLCFYAIICSKVVFYVMPVPCLKFIANTDELSSHTCIINIDTSYSQHYIPNLLISM